MSRRDEQRVSITMTDFDMYCAARVERDKLKAENGRLQGRLKRIYDATLDNPEKLTISDVARIAKEPQS